MANQARDSIRRGDHASRADRTLARCIDKPLVTPKDAARKNS
jgi:hypothetical protein